MIDRLDHVHREVAAREKQLEEVKKASAPLARAYGVQRQSLGKMVAKEAIQKKVMNALEMRLEQKQSDLRRVRTVHEACRLQLPSVPSVQFAQPAQPAQSSQSSQSVQSVTPTQPAQPAQPIKEENTPSCRVVDKPACEEQQSEETGKRSPPALLPHTPVAVAQASDDQTPSSNTHVENDLQTTTAEMNKAWNEYLSLRKQLHQLQASARREADDVTSLQRTLFSARQLNRDETTMVRVRWVAEE